MKSAVLLFLTCCISVSFTLPQNSPGLCQHHGLSGNGESGPGKIGDCTQYTCHALPDGKETVSTAGCPVFRFDPNRADGRFCKTVTDNTKPYPDCCPKPSCTF